MKRLTLDIETNGLLFDMDTIHVIVIQDIDTKEIKQFTGEFEGLREILEGADLIVAHNGIAFDFPVLKSFLDIDIPYSKMMDTVILSRILHPDKRILKGARSQHSLENWGLGFHFPKGDFNDWSKLSQEMIDYCIQDVRITTKIFEFLEPKLEEYKSSIMMDMEFAYYMSLQEANGFTLDIEKATRLSNKFENERNALVRRLQKIVPPFKVYTATYKEAVNGSRIIEETENDYTYITGKTKKVVTKDFKFTRFNPNSRKQIISYFQDKYSWEPNSFTDKGTPKVDATILQGLEYEEAQVLARIMRLTKKLGMIRDGENSWIKHMKSDGRVHGSVLTSGANGGRCTHSSPNMAQVDKKDLDMRDCWIPKKGWTLVGADASGLELRILAHYLAFWDKGAYAQIVLNGDIHTHNMNSMGLQSRDNAKTAIYALIYGAGNIKLGSIVAEDREFDTKNPRVLMGLGKKLRDRVEDNITGYKELVESIGKTVAARNFLKGIDGRPLYPRNDYSALNLLGQSAGATIMKKALNIFFKITKYTHGEDFALCANVHDEWQIECRNEIAEDLGKEMILAMEKTTEVYKLRCPLTGEYSVGSSWKFTH